MKQQRVLRALNTGLNQPEVNVAVFAFLLNFVWETWQLPLYEGAASIPYWNNLKGCTVATLGDVVIALSAFWITAGVIRSRWWIVHPTLRQIAGFVLVGVLVTIVLETWATGSLHRRSYAEAMPTLPLLGTGLMPVLQWIVLPSVTIDFVGRQLTCLDE